MASAANETVEQAPRVLVAEDNPASQRLVDIILSSLGYDLTLVDNGRQAVQAAEVARFDLVLMDLRMPVLNGFEAAKLIRQLPDARGAPPILAVTADVRPRIEADVLEAGMNGCLFKPVDVTSLTEIVATWAGRGPRLSRAAYSR